MIVCNPEVNFGMPALKDRRLTVYDIVTKLYTESTVSFAIKDYEISMNDAKDAVEYCVGLKCKHDNFLEHFCDGCVLRTIQEGWAFNKKDYVEIKEDDQIITITIDGLNIFIGTMQEMEDSEFGRITWLIAEEVKGKMIFETGSG